MTNKAKKLGLLVVISSLSLIHSCKSLLKHPTLSADDDIAQNASGAAVLLQVDASGRGGSTGSTGFSGSDSYSRGQQGGTGGEGDRGGTGQNAGAIDFTVGFQDSAYSGVLKISGFVQKPSASSPQTLSKSIIIGDSGFIYLLANGGRGGTGGTGGVGGQGGQGFDGKDATENSNATPGGPGAPGGSGGPGGPGGTGGDAGNIIIRMDEKDTGALLLFNVENDPGRGGTPGDGGPGGPGGPGGKGGAGISYQEEYTEQVSDGKGGTTTVTRTRLAYRSAGSDGSQGSQGSSGSDSNSRGRDGRTGSYKMIVRENGKDVTYTEMYALKILSYNFDSADTNNIIEPGEMVTVSNFKLKNTGGMPTPPQRAVVLLRNSEWVIAEKMEVEIPRLKPGEEVTLQDVLKFKVKSNDLSSKGERLSAEGTIFPIATLEKVRDFPGSENIKKFEVTYPIEISPITALNSLSPGQATKMYWTVKNISSRPFGKASEIGREITTGLGFGNLSDQIVLYDTSGKEIDFSSSNSFLQSIENLQPGESRIVETVLKVSESATAYDFVGINSRLNLERINKKENQEIQNRDFTIRVGTQKKIDVENDVLLIPNQGTTKEEFEAYRQLFAALSMDVGIFDVSLNGALRLTELANDGTGIIAQYFENKALVMLNNEFTSAANQGLRSISMARAEDMLSALTEHGIATYIVGGQSKKTGAILEKFLLADEKLGRDYGTIEELLNDQSVDITLQDTAEVLTNRKTITNSFSQITLNSWTFFGKPKESWLAKRAKKLQNDLNKKYPERNFFVVHRFNPESLQGGFFKRWKYGTLEVRDAMDVEGGSAVAIKVNDADMHSSKFVTSTENIAGMFKSWPFKRKMLVLRNLIAGKIQSNPSVNVETIADALSGSILLDLMDEQAAVRRNTVASNLQDKSIKEQLVHLNELEREIGNLQGYLDPNSQAGRTVIDILTRLHVAMSRGMPFLDYVFSLGGNLPLTRNVRVTKVTEATIAAIAKDSFVEDLLARKSNTPTRGAFVAREKELNDRLATKWKSSTRQSWQLCVDKVVLDGVERVNYLSIQEVRDRIRSGELSGAEYDQLIAEEKLRVDAANQHETSIKQAQSDLLVNLPACDKAAAKSRNTDPEPDINFNDRPNSASPMTDDRVRE